jgi:CBS domain-containing protein
MTGLLADSVAVRGVDELRLLTLDAVGRHSFALRAMLQDATAARATIPSRLRVFATHIDAVDLKQAAVEPIAKIARWAALSAGAGAISTLERLDAAAGAQTVDADDAATLRECYLAVSRIRWRARASAWIDGKPITEVVSLAGMSPQDRATLRDIGREVGGVRRKLSFLAATSPFS